MRITNLIMLYALSSALIAGCTAAPKLPERTAVYVSGETAAVAGGKTADHEKRSKFLRKVEAEMSGLRTAAQTELSKLRAKAENQSEFALGVGAVGILAGIAAAALIAASPANAVWVAALSGLSGGVNAFQAKMGSEGITREAITEVYNDYSKRLRTDSGEFAKALGATYAVVDDGADKWNPAAGKLRERLDIYAATVIDVGIPSVAKALEALHKENARLEGELKELRKK